MRAIPERPETVAERVAFIADMMADLEWERGKSAKLLAERWDMAQSTIENYSAEASRMVTGDEEEARRDITAGCRKLFKDAVANLDAKGAKAVGELWAQVSGAKAPDKHQVGTLDDVTPQKAREVMAGLFGAVTPDAGGPGDGASSSETEPGASET